ncbi:curlin, partial [Enterobacter cloacae]
MKFIKVAALAAIVVSGSAMAGLIDQGGWGHGHGHGHGQGGNGPNSTLNIYQNGGGNSAVAL